MRSNATTGSPLSICLSVCALMVLLSITGTANAKRGCSAFGHSCFGGHGKRFDPHIQDNMLQQNKPAATSGRSQDVQAVRLRKEFHVVGENIGDAPETFFPLTRREDPTRVNPYTLSLIVRQWLTSHHRLHQLDVESNNK